MNPGEELELFVQSNIHVVYMFNTNMQEVGGHMSFTVFQTWQEV